MQNLTFGTEGPIMSGTWYNPNNGDSFTVHDSFFEDNQYVVQTTDGRFLKYDQIQNYVKSDKPLDMNALKLDKSQSKEPTVSDLPPEVMGLLETTHTAGDPYNSLGNIYEPSTIKNEPEILSGLNGRPILEMTNNAIIDKALSKRTMPDIQIGINWNKCPLKEMKMLIDLMDVKQEEVADWYVNNVNIENITQIVKSSLKSYIDELFNLVDEKKPKPKKKDKK